MEVAEGLAEGVHASSGVVGVAGLGRLSYAATTSSTATVDEARATMSPSSVCLVWRPSSEMT